MGVGGQRSILILLKALVGHTYGLDQQSVFDQLRPHEWTVLPIYESI